MKTVKIKLNTSVLDALPGNTEKRSKRIVDAAQAALAAEMRASAPRDTGELAGSIEELEAGTGRNVVGIVRVNADHAIHVEYGTAFMGARAFIRPSVRRIKARFMGDAKGVLK